MTARWKATKTANPLHGDWGKSLGKGCALFVDELRKADVDGFPPVAESTWRQMRTAAEILRRYRLQRKGVLLADDVGLGKTYIAGLLAAIFACTGKRVRVVAPSDLVKAQWIKALVRVVEAVKGWQGSEADNFHTTPVKGVGSSEKLADGQIAVSTRSYAQARSLECDLLIVDEAHRGSLTGHEGTFVTRLWASRKQYKHLLLLTATPFSIDPKVIARLVSLCIADVESKRNAWHVVREYGAALDKLHGSLDETDVIPLTASLATAANEAVLAMKRYVIRHSRKRLVLEAGEKGKPRAKREVNRLGVRVEWLIDVDDASPKVLELLVRMDRAQRISRAWGKSAKGATNDARFHSGWEEFNGRFALLEKATNKLSGKFATERTAAGMHVEKMGELRAGLGHQDHPKVSAVAAAIEKVVCSPTPQRVLVFCHHVSTAVEIGRAIDRRLAAAGKANRVRIAVDPRRSNLDAAPDELFLKTDGKIKKARERFRGKDNSLLVFVATDKLSEGLDFHEHCNRMVHFEYSPSPLRTIQREGRLFRILGDGKKRARKIHVAVPVFRGTRDELLVKVMRDRLEAFDMLLGGVREVTSEDEEAGASEAIRGEIVRRVRKKLLRGKRLAVN